MKPDTTDRVINDQVARPNPLWTFLILLRLRTRSAVVGCLGAIAASASIANTTPDSMLAAGTSSKAGSIWSVRPNNGVASIRAVKVAMAAEYLPYRAPGPGIDPSATASIRTRHRLFTGAESL